MPARIFIVEDHPVMRKMVSEFIDADASDIEVCGAAETGEEALERLPDAAADLALIDMSLPGMTGIDLVKTLRARRLDLPCLLYSGHREAAYAERALAAGAQGYLLKGDPYELAGAIRRVLDGETYLGTSIKEQVGGS